MFGFLLLFVCPAQFLHALRFDAIELESWRFTALAVAIAFETRLHELFAFFYACKSFVCITM